MQAERFEHCRDINRPRWANAAECGGRFLFSMKVRILLMMRRAETERNRWMGAALLQDYLEISLGFALRSQRRRNSDIVWSWTQRRTNRRRYDERRQTTDVCQHGFSRFGQFYSLGDYKLNDGLIRQTAPFGTPSFIGIRHLTAIAEQSVSLEHAHQQATSCLAQPKGQIFR